MTEKEQLWQIFLNSGSTEDYLNYRRFDITNSMSEGKNDGDNNRCVGAQRTEYR